MTIKNIYTTLVLALVLILNISKSVAKTPSAEMSVSAIEQAESQISKTTATMPDSDIDEGSVAESPKIESTALEGIAVNRTEVESVNVAESKAEENEVENKTANMPKTTDNGAVNHAQKNENTLTESQDIAKEIERIKKEVLQLNRELFILEEDLLFPASTEVAVFVSVDIGRFFTLDSVELKLNDNNVAGFLYTNRQRQSLEQGGIQQLFKGNLKSGEHELTAIFIGLDNEKRKVKRAVSYQFEKEDDAVMIELKLEDDTHKLQAQVSVEEWIL